MSHGKRLDPDTLRATLKRLMGVSPDAWKDVDAIKDHIAAQDEALDTAMARHMEEKQRRLSLEERLREVLS